MSERIFDLIQIGRGPCGLMMAALTAQLGHSIAVVERHRDLYGLPRAGHIDHEIVRMLQSVGAAAPVLQDSYPTTEYVWKNADGETLLEFDWGAKSVSGYNSDYMQFQPVLEGALSDIIAASPLVTEYTGWEAVTFHDHGDHVEVSLHRTDNPDEKLTLRGRYLIASDGANSFVRRSLGIHREDFGFNEQWLVVDARKKRDVTLDFDCGQMCDPARPITVLPLGKRHRRWEWMRLPGETAEELTRPETAWRLLADFKLTPDDLHIIRQLVYTFEARLAHEWRRGRVVLMGDAIHTMPPFMGQGMCSGMRDTKNLVWKLDLLLRGVVGDGILDTYMAERLPHVRDWTLISLEAGKVPCTVDPAKARERDELFRSGWRPPMPNFPRLIAGVIQTDATGKPTSRAGDLSLQARVERDGRIELFDTFFPPLGFSIVSTVANPRSVLRDDQIVFLRRLRTEFVHVGGDVGDADGTYRDFFAAHGIEAVVNRPDFYVFGTAPSLSDLPALVDDLWRQLAPLEAAVRVAA